HAATHAIHPRPRRPQFGTSLRRTVVADDRAGVGAAGLLERAQRAERARIVDRADDDAARLAGAEVLAHRLEAVAEHAVAVEVGDAPILEVRARFLHADQHPGQPHLRQTAGALQGDE